MVFVPLFIMVVGRWSNLWQKHELMSRTWIDCEIQFRSPQQLMFWHWLWIQDQNESSLLASSMSFSKRIPLCLQGPLQLCHYNVPGSKLFGLKQSKHFALILQLNHHKRSIKEGFITCWIKNFGIGSPKVWIVTFLSKSLFLLSCFTSRFCLSRHCCCSPSAADESEAPYEEFLPHHQVNLT